VAEPITFLACFACGTTSSATLATLCPRCEELRVADAVAQRCAPLVEALEQVMARPDQPVFEVARDALAAYYAAQAEGREDG
jgi:hypothetical protein